MREDVIAVRRRRLTASLAYYAGLESIREIVLLDATLGPEDAESIAKQAGHLVRIPGIKTHPEGAYKGPSYLEGLLYAGFRESFEADEDLVFKITGGYVVRNFDEIRLAIQSQGLRGIGWLVQPPLDLRFYYALTSCYALRGDLFAAFLEFAARNVEQLRERPLEEIYCRFLLGLGGKRRSRVPYPDLDAYFTSGGFHSSAPRYRFKNALWSFFASRGLNTLALRDDHLLPG
jgi:hypothetical protein